MTQDELKKLAHLARIELTDGELATFSKDFDSILGYVDQINQIDVAEVAPQHLQENVARADADANASGAYVEKMLADAPSSQSGFYKVPKIL